MRDFLGLHQKCRRNDFPAKKNFIGIIKSVPRGPSRILLRGGQNKIALALSFVSKNSNSKHQITNKLQILISNDLNLIRRDIV
jgi:hypothetical protein